MNTPARIRCAKCKQLVASVVIDSRMYNGTMRRRRRRCPLCKHRWSTWEGSAEQLASEATEQAELKVIDEMIADLRKRRAVITGAEPSASRR